MMDVLQTDLLLIPVVVDHVNINGEVIGVNSLKLVKDEIEGMGFAIPEIVMSAVGSLEKGEEIKTFIRCKEMYDAKETYALYRRGFNMKSHSKTVLWLLMYKGNSGGSCRVKKVMLY